MISQEIDAISTKIRTKLHWYEEHGASIQSIHLLMKFQIELGGLYFRLSEISASAKKGFVYSIMQRKIGVSREQVNLLKQNLKQWEVKLKAEELTSALVTAEHMAEIEAFRCEMLMKPIDHILRIVHQQISTLKQEQSESKRQV